MLFINYGILLIQIVIHFDVAAPLRIFVLIRVISQGPRTFSFPFYSKFSSFVGPVYLFSVVRFTCNLLGALS